jgi:thiol-disulfide isomerase/thioredoxin
MSETWSLLSGLGLELIVGVYHQCGYCKKMKPAYEKVAKAFKSESNVSVGSIGGATVVASSDPPDIRFLFFDSASSPR